jgi:3D-(3,5/4)-trihydroxycyclohexane-1,2-dione acylhydrolase (decyclizing)
MLPGELVTAVAERIPMVIVLVDNHGYASIAALSRSIGSDEFGTQSVDGSGNELAIDLAANAESVGARVIRATTIDDLRAALRVAPDADGPVVIYIEADRHAAGLDSESWWDVPVAEVSEEPDVRAARERYERARRSQRRVGAHYGLTVPEPLSGDDR